MTAERTVIPPPPGDGPPAAPDFRGEQDKPAPTSAVLLARLQRLHPKRIDLSLHRVERLLARLGHPEQRLPPVIHIAGTNGKGSVQAFLKAIYTAAGRVCHAYTSPHLVDFHERISLAGAPIGEAPLAALLEEVAAATDGEAITFFEVTTAAAFLAFSRAPADLLILETGLGGRLDATNVVSAPLATVITPISLDHQAFLGTSLTAIAGEKAGILKPRIPVICGPQPPEALEVILHQAEILGSEAWVRGRDWWALPSGDGMVYRCRRQERRLPKPGLAGPHQIDNAGLAIAVTDRLQRRFPVNTRILAQGLASVHWPARLQRLRTGTLVALLAPGEELWLDGGHNEAAALALAEAVRSWDRRPLYLVVGMMNNKDISRFLSILAPLAEEIRAVPVPGQINGLPAEDLARLARAVMPTARAASSVSAALTGIRRREPRPARLLICGSLYLAGSVLARNTP